MLQLDILSGQQAGARRVARRFPFRLGRAAESDLRLEDDGVWERHAEIRVEPAQGGVLFPHADAFTAVNGHPIREAVLLRNGDLIELGSLQLRFGLSPTRQSSLRFREILTWIGLGLLCLGQVGLIYWLLS